MKLTRYPVYDCHHADADSTTLSNPIGYATTRGGAIRILRRQYGGELEPRGAELLDVERHGATVWDGLMNWDDLYLNPEVIKELKKAALDEDRPAYEITEEAVSAWLAAHKRIPKEDSE